MDDRRAVSTAVSYTMTLGITTLLITGLLVAGGTFLETQTEETSRTELTVIGQQLAGLVSSADGLAVSTSEGSFTMRREMPRTVAGSTYVVNITDETTPSADRYRYRLTLNATAGGSDVVEVTTETPVATPAFNGGPIRVDYNTTGNTLEVRDD